VVEAGHDPRRFATDLLDRLRDLIVLNAVPEAGGNGLLDCPPDRLDLMSRQAQALGAATLSRLADTVHEGLTEMRGTTAPRLLLELVCARMLLPGVDGSAAATLQRLERLERRMSIAGEHAGRPEPAVAAAAPAAPVRPAPAPAPVERAPEPQREPAPAAAVAAAPAAAAPAAARPAYVRPSQARAAATAGPVAAPAPASAAPEGDDGWPVTARPGAMASAPAPAPAPSGSSGDGPPTVRPRPPVAAGEPDVPLPPEPTDDEDWPQPTRAAAPQQAPARPPQPEPAAPAAPPAATPAPAPAPAPRAAAESAPAPRGGEPTPLVSATPEEPAGGDGELTTVDVRRIWPELLAVVKRHKRTTEALLKSAQVHDLTNGTLTLVATSPALAKMLGDDLNKDIVRQALQELLGVRWKVQAVVDTPGQPAAGPAPTPEAARAAVQAAESAEADELMAERAAEVTPDGADAPPPLDPEAAALQLLRTQLGARPIDS
jgi:DNA polymerase III subunit gamma/tau